MLLPSKNLRECLGFQTCLCHLMCSRHGNVSCQCNMNIGRHIASFYGCHLFIYSDVSIQRLEHMFQWWTGLIVDVVWWSTCCWLVGWLPHSHRYHYQIPQVSVLSSFLLGCSCAWIWGKWYWSQLTSPPSVDFEILNPKWPEVKNLIFRLWDPKGWGCIFLSACRLE